MKSTEELFLDGLSLHRGGRSAEDEACYAVALQIDPGHFKALQHLSALRSDHGALHEAADLFAKVARGVNPDRLIFASRIHDRAEYFGRLLRQGRPS